MKTNKCDRCKNYDEEIGQRDSADCLNYEPKKEPEPIWLTPYKNEYPNSISRGERVQLEKIERWGCGKYYCFVMRESGYSSWYEAAGFNELQTESSIQKHIDLLKDREE
jgi:hypothetical protein